MFVLFLVLVPFIVGALLRSTFAPNPIACESDAPDRLD